MCITTLHLCINVTHATKMKGPSKYLGFLRNAFGVYVAKTSGLCTYVHCTVKYVSSPTEKYQLLVLGSDLPSLAENWSQPKGKILNYLVGGRKKKHWLFGRDRRIKVNWGIGSVSEEISVTNYLQVRNWIAFWTTPMDRSYLPNFRE